MDVLWSADGDRWLTVREVHESLAADRDLAYTTVMTVLARLAGKGLASQLRDGKAYRYQAEASRAELTAELMRETLDDFTSHDRGQALVAFVDEASADDLAALRLALSALDEPR
jgi:predicted transcriptional regulator